MVDTLLGAGFLQTGGSADKAREYGDIRRYGAQAGGVFDNYAAITAALAANEAIHVPPGIWGFGAAILPPAGRKICGAGQGISILQALSYTHNGILIQDVDDVTVTGLTVRGVFNASGITGGIVLVRANYCHIDNVTIKDWSAQGLALRFATYNQIGNITTINNGHRGVNVSALSHHNTFGEIIATGNKLAAVNINYGCHDNTMASVIGGGHENAGFWIQQDCYQNTIGEIIMGPPAAGFEGNSALLFAWHTHENYVGRLSARGWRRGIQFKAANIVASGDAAVDPFLTEGNTEGNTVGSAWIETDNGTNAAGVSFDSASSRIVSRNKVLSLYVKNATYGVRDTIGDSAQNVFIEQTFENVTAPWSLPAFGTNGGFCAGTINISADYYRGGTKVVGARDTGWTAMTGTANEATPYATGSITLIQLAERVKALQDALTTHGLIGA